MIPFLENGRTIIHNPGGGGKPVEKTPAGPAFRPKRSFSVKPDPDGDGRRQKGGRSTDLDFALGYAPAG
jgi:hypothetical protein